MKYRDTSCREHQPATVDYGSGRHVDEYTMPKRKNTVLDTHQLQHITRELQPHA